MNESLNNRVLKYLDQMTVYEDAKIKNARFILQSENVFDLVDEKISGVIVEKHSQQTSKRICGYIFESKCHHDGKYIIGPDIDRTVILNDNLSCVYTKCKSMFLVVRDNKL